MLSERMMLVIGQVYLAILSLVLAIAPKYYTFVFIIYFVAIMALGMYSARSSGGRSVPREEIERARTLLKEDKAFELAMEDEELVKQYAGQAKTMLVMLMLFPVYILLFKSASMYHDEIIARLESMGISSTMAGFIFWLLVFETMFAISQLTRRIVARGGRGQPPLVPHGFRVTEKGIVVKGSFGQVIGFPLPEGSEVRLDEAKNYVEIKYPRGNRVRLYTRKARKLYEYIRRYGLQHYVGEKESANG